MSIGEIINLYKDGDIKLNPAFQRLFRWKEEQKTKFIESILIGIPVPEIFVAQDAKAQWTIVDGVQRISTILQLTGDLPDKDPLKMTSTKYLSDLENQHWEDLPSEAQRLIKRAKLGINIILTENSIQAQYELFQRLNTGGVHLAPQELRNCLMIMLDETFYEKINKVKEHQSFKNTLQLSESKYLEEYHMEIILRFLIAVFSKLDYDQYSLHSVHIRDFLDEETVALIENKKFNLDDALEIFKETFDWIESELGLNAFKRYDKEREKFIGPFSNAIFEAIAPGVALNLHRLKKDKVDLKSMVKILQQENTFLENSKHGVRAPIRYKNLTNFSNEFFANVS